MGKKRTLQMSVKVVPPGTLPLNPNNPFAKESPTARRSGMIRTLIQSLARIRQQAPLAKCQHPVVTSAAIAIPQAAQTGLQRSRRSGNKNVRRRTTEKARANS